MARKPVSHKYDTCKIPEGLTKKVDELLEIDDSFTSRTDVIKHAVRLLYRARKEI